MVPTYLCNVFKALQKQGLVDESAPYFHEDGIMYFWLKNMPEKTIAIKACHDSSEHLWIYAEAIDTEKIVTKNGGRYWIETVSVRPSVPTRYYPNIYGALFEGLFVWSGDVMATVETIIETCDLGLTSLEASQS